MRLGETVEQCRAASPDELLVVSVGGRLFAEAQATALLHHTNIVPVHGVGAERGVHYYAMQFIDGRTLADVISELRQLEGKTREGEPAGRACKVQAPVGSPPVRWRNTQQSESLLRALPAWSWASCACQLASWSVVASCGAHIELGLPFVDACRWN